MEEAQALALAEAALFAEAERDRHQYEGMPFDAMEASIMTESESQVSMDHHNQLGGYGMQEAELLENLMNLPDDESRHQLLQLLQQQEQQQHIQESLRMRPDRHYLTISKEGKRNLACFCCVRSVYITRHYHIYGRLTFSALCEYHS